jgi:hypothetical protein
MIAKLTKSTKKNSSVFVGIVVFVIVVMGA